MTALCFRPENITYVTQFRIFGRENKAEFCFASKMEFCFSPASLQMEFHFYGKMEFDPSLLKLNYILISERNSLTQDFSLGHHALHHRGLNYRSLES